MYKSQKVSPKIKEDDPNYKKYSNFSKILDEQKLNKFKDMVKKLLKDIGLYKN